MIKAYNMNVWKCHNETYYSVWLVYSNSKIRVTIEIQNAPVL
jgi:hypothetical protein